MIIKGKKTVLLSVILLLTKLLYAQQTDSLKYKYINQTIYRFGNVYQKGTERLVFRDLQFEFSISDLGMDGYQKAKKLAATSTVLRIISFAASVAAVSVAANNGNRNTAFILLGGQVVFGLAAAKYYGMSRSTLDRALWQRNKDVLFPGK